MEPSDSRSTLYPGSMKGKAQALMVQATALSACHLPNIQISSETIGEQDDSTGAFTVGDVFRFLVAKTWESCTSLYIA